MVEGVLDVVETILGPSCVWSMAREMWRSCIRSSEMVFCCSKASGWSIRIRGGLLTSRRKVIWTHQGPALFLGKRRKSHGAGLTVRRKGRDCSKTSPCSVSLIV